MLFPGGKSVLLKLLKRVLQEIQRQSQMGSKTESGRSGDDSFFAAQLKGHSRLDKGVCNSACARLWDEKETTEFPTRPVVGFVSLSKARCMYQTGLSDSQRVEFEAQIERT